jgi:hypothetical protein
VVDRSRVEAFAGQPYKLNGNIHPLPAPQALRVRSLTKQPITVTVIIIMIMWDANMSFSSNEKARSVATYTSMYTHVSQINHTHGVRIG